jgi:hypothetical protein
LATSSVSEEQLIMSNSSISARVIGSWESVACQCFWSWIRRMNVSWDLHLDWLWPLTFVGFRARELLRDIVNQSAQLVYEVKQYRKIKGCSFSCPRDHCLCNIGSNIESQEGKDVSRVC